MTKLPFLFCRGCNILFRPCYNAQKFHSKECQYNYYYQKNKDRIKENVYLWRKDKKYKELQRKDYKKRIKVNNN